MYTDHLDARNQKHIDNFPSFYLMWQKRLSKRFELNDKVEIAEGLYPTDHTLFPAAVNSVVKSLPFNNAVIFTDRETQISLNIHITSNSYTWDDYNYTLKYY